MYAYADMGCPIYADTVCDLPDGGGMFYCNIYQMRYTYMLESSFKNLESDESIKKVLDDLATKKRAIIYSHPHYAVLRDCDCWDALNYKKKNHREFGDWIQGEKRTPDAVTEEVTLSGKDLKESVKDIDTTRFLPTEIKVGDKIIGPADWLRAAMQVIMGKETVTVKPAPALPSLDAIPPLRDCDFTKSRWVQSDEFEDKYLSKRLKLQCWTMRFMKED